MWRQVWDTVFGALGAVAGFLWGGLTGMLIALLAFMAFDYLSGVMVAIKKKKVSSAVGYKGLLKKAGILLCVAVGHVLDVYVLGGAAVMMTACELFFIANEGISVLENLGRLGVPYPKKLKDVLEALKNKSEDKNKEE